MICGVLHSMEREIVLLAPKCFVNPNVEQLSALDISTYKYLSNLV